MTPYHCRVKHNPPESYGDCLRACIATVLEIDPLEIPHFVDNGVSGDVVLRSLRDWLKPHRLQPFVAGYPPVPLEQLLEHVGRDNPSAVYLLFGGTGGGNDHVVVCKGDQICWNPAWAGGKIVEPASSGEWLVMVLGRI